MLTKKACPVCDRAVWPIHHSRSLISHDSELRESFVNRRLGHMPESLEAMDLTRFMHGGQARLLICPTCGVLVRDEDRQSQYEDDAYDSVLMNHLCPRYVQAFEDKQSQYQPMLRNGAEVLEVGSHLGAFLQVAEEWGWRPIGLDIGESTRGFARRKGLSVKNWTIEDYSPRLRKPEAIFIWNCFEQLEDPRAAIRRSHQLLGHHGLLVVRVPNADFYRQKRQELEIRHSHGARAVLGYNNLLGFPYLYGYTPEALERLLRANQFEPISAHNSSLLTPPYPDMSPSMIDEWRKARRDGEDCSGVAGPWIEVVSRRVACE